MLTLQEEICTMVCKTEKLKKTIAAPSTRSNGADERAVLAYRRMRWGIDVQKAGMDLLCNIQIVHTEPRNELGREQQ